MNTPATKQTGVLTAQQISQKLDALLRKQKPNKPKRRGIRVTGPPQRVVVVRESPSNAHDATTRRYINGIANPFEASPTKGICNTSFYTRTALVARRNVFSVTLNLSTAGPSGAEFFIPQATSSDPWVIVAYRAGGGATTATAWSNTGGTVDLASFGYNTTSTIPTTAAARIVASSVRIMCTDNANTANGSWSHYWQPHGVDGGTANAAPSLAIGAAALTESEALSVVPVSAGKTITFVNPSGVSWVAATTPASATLGMGATATLGTTALPTGVTGTRLYYSGSGTVTFKMEVISHIEYYHDDHRHFGTPSVTHKDGEQLTQAVNAALTVPGSNRTYWESYGSPEKFAKYLAKAAGLVDSAQKFGQAAVNAVGMTRAMRRAMGSNSLMLRNEL